MAKLSILAGTTSKMVKVFIQNNSVTTGAGLTGLVFNTAGLTAYYIREGAGATVAISLATATLGTWATGGFIVVDGTNMPGAYELSIPNLALAAGAKSVLIYLQGATNMAPVLLEIELTAVDNQSTAFGLSIAKTTNITGFNDITAAAAATGVWQDTTAGDFTVASSIGKSLYTTGAVPGATGGLFIAGTNAATTVTTSFTTTFTGNLTGSVGSVTGLTASNLDTTVSSRMATYAQPTGFLAATFPTGTIANTTNITAGTITTATNLTNAPTAGDFTATMKTSLNASTPASVTTVTGNVNGSVASVTGTVTITSNVKKNQALNAFTFLMTDSTTHTPKTGLTVTATRSLDGAAFAACANAVLEIAFGWYQLNLATTDTNANVVSLRFTAAAADDRDIQLVTQP